MTQTTEQQIDEMKALAEKLGEDPMVESAWIDDWGRFGNFTLIMTPATWDRTATNRLKGLVSRSLKGMSAHLRDTFPPERIGNDFMGKPAYHSTIWKFDIDYQDYDIGTNSFSGQ